MLKFWKKKPAETTTTPADPIQPPIADAAPAEPGFERLPAAPESASEPALDSSVIEVDQLPTAESAPAKRGWRERLSGNAFSRGLTALFVRHPKLDDELLDELETTLISADVGVEASSELVEQLRKRMHKREFADAPALLAALREALVALLRPVEQPLDVRGRRPFVVLVVGINGAGKTTTIGKLARR